MADVKTVLLLAAVVALPIDGARAEFVPWTTGDGKAAELEFVALHGKAAATMVELRDRAGQAVKLKLADLAEADRGRALEAAKLAAATPELIFRGTSMENRGAKDTRQMMRFQFDISGGLTPLKPVKLSVKPSKLGADKDELRTRHWGWTMHTDAAQKVTFSFAPVSATKEMDLSSVRGVDGTVLLEIGSARKELETEIELPQQRGAEQKKKLGPLELALFWAKDDTLLAYGKGPEGFEVMEVYVIVKGQREQHFLKMSELAPLKRLRVVVEYVDSLRQVEIPFAGKG